MFTTEQIDTIAIGVVNDNDERHGSFITSLCKTWLLADPTNKRYLHDIMTHMITQHDLDRELLK